MATGTTEESTKTGVVELSFRVKNKADKLYDFILGALCQEAREQCEGVRAMKPLAVLEENLYETEESLGEILNILETELVRRL